ncbi:hypothetical protein ACFXKS_12410 [Streptomyces scopuliridis]|uniref:hypothetical protein n=1 Tax=Streptomyces scopuliridis TaxID=452529 RepID=UPI00369E143B
MTILTRERLSGTSVHIHRGDTGHAKPFLLRRDGDRFITTYDPKRADVGTAAVLTRALLSSEGVSVSEVILEGHDPALTDLYHAASKLLLNVEITRGKRITKPVVKVVSQDPMQATYCVPEKWDLLDAVGRLPSAFADARPKAARHLKLIEQAKKDSDGKIGYALDVMARLILETDDPDSVYDEMLHLFDQDRTEGTSADAPATAV